MRKKILIVDDHADFRKVVKNYLNLHKLNIEIFEANSGEMGVTKASFVKPHIVLMDINLPNINGLEAVRRIREDHPVCDVIILTVFDVPVMKKVAEKIKAVDFIGKNDIYDRLMPALMKCLEK